MVWWTLERLETIPPRGLTTYNQHPELFREPSDSESERADNKPVGVNDLLISSCFLSLFLSYLLLNCLSSFFFTASSTYSCIIDYPLSALIISALERLNVEHLNKLVPFLGCRTTLRGHPPPPKKKKKGGPQYINLGVNVSFWQERSNLPRWTKSPPTELTDTVIRTNGRLQT